MTVLLILLTAACWAVVIFLAYLDSRTIKTLTKVCQDLIEDRNWWVNRAEEIHGELKALRSKKGGA